MRPRPVAWSGCLDHQEQPLAGVPVGLAGDRAALAGDALEGHHAERVLGVQVGRALALEGVVGHVRGAGRSGGEHGDRQFDRLAGVGHRVHHCDGQRDGPVQRPAVAAATAAQSGDLSVGRSRGGCGDGWGEDQSDHRGLLPAGVGEPLTRELNHGSGVAVKRK